MSETMDEPVDPCILKREPGEPMFVLLARDSAAPETLERWAILRTDEIVEGKRPNTEQEHAHIAEVRAMARAFRKWRKQHRAV